MEEFIEYSLTQRSDNVVPIFFDSESMCETLFCDHVNGLHTFELICDCTINKTHPRYLLHAMSDNYKEYLVAVEIMVINNDMAIIEKNLLNLHSQDNIQKIKIIEIKRVISYKLEWVDEKHIYFSFITLKRSRSYKNDIKIVKGKCRSYSRGGSNMTIRQLYESMYKGNKNVRNGNKLIGINTSWKNSELDWNRFRNNFRVYRCYVYRENVQKSCIFDFDDLEDSIDIIIHDNKLCLKILQKVLDKTILDGISERRNIGLSIMIKYEQNNDEDEDEDFISLIPIKDVGILPQKERNSHCPEEQSKYLETCSRITEISLIIYSINEANINISIANNAHISFLTATMKRLFNCVIIRDRNNEKVEFLCTMIELFKNREIDTFTMKEFRKVNLFRELITIRSVINFMKDDCDVLSLPMLIMREVVEQYTLLQIRQSYGRHKIPFENMIKGISKFDEEFKSFSQ